MVDSVIQWINHATAQRNWFWFYLSVDGNLSGRQCYPTFEQLGPDIF